MLSAKCNGQRLAGDRSAVRRELPRGGADVHSRVAAGCGGGHRRRGQTLLLTIALFDPGNSRAARAAAAHRLASAGGRVLAVGGHRGAGVRAMYLS